MSAFKLLKDSCNKFEEELGRINAALYSTKIGESFEDGIAKKMRDIPLFTAKMRLLKAKLISLNPKITSQEKNEDAIINNYAELAACKLVERQVVKSVAQGHAVRALITARDNDLDHELVERKEKIIASLSEYGTKQTTLQMLERLMKEKEAEHADVRARWDTVVGELRDVRAGANGVEDVDSTGPLYDVLRVTVGKLELMRWLISRLVMPRTRGYDWLRDPHRRITALRLAREANTIEKFVQ